MVSGKRILLIAAEPREFSGLVRLCTAVRRLPWALDWARSGELNGNTLWMAANGAGAHRSALAGKAAPRPDAVVSYGFCGAVDPALELAQVLVATEIAAGVARIPAERPQASRPYAAGVVASIDRIAQTAAEKSILRDSGAAAVEMEAAGAAACAHRWGVPLYCVRAVTDLAHESFRNDFNAALRSDGHFATMHLIRAASRHPAVLLPELFRLQSRCRRAARVLGEFIADCRF